MDHTTPRAQRSLARLILGRLVQLVVVVWAVTSVVFVLQVQSGDPVAVVPVDEATRIQIRRELGYLDPLEVRYARFWQGVLIPHESRTSIAGVLDFGASTRAQWPAIHFVLNPLRITAALLGVTMGLAMLLGVPLGVLAGLHNHRVARVVYLMKLVSMSVPAFLIGMALWFIFARGVTWQLYDPTVTTQDWELPVLALLGYPMLRIADATREAVATQMRRDRVIAARTVKLSETAIFMRHVLPPLAGQILATLSANLKLLMSTIVVVEWLVSWPGAGQQLVISNFVRDYNVILAIVFVTGIAAILSGLLLDLLRWMVDPLFRAGISTEEQKRDTLQTLTADAGQG